MLALVYTLAALGTSDTSWTPAVVVVRVPTYASRRQWLLLGDGAHSVLVGKSAMRRSVRFHYR